MARNAKQAGGSLKRRSPDEVRFVRASGNEISFEEEIVMANSSTNVIPFNFGKHQVRTLLIDDQPWFAAQDVLDSLEYAETYKPARAMSHVPDAWKGVHRLHTLGGSQQALMISEQGLYFVLGRSDKPKALPFQIWLAGDVLPAIRKTGRYEDNKAKMPTLIDELIGVSELSVIKGLIRDKGKAVASDKRQSFALTMHNRLHTRFNVPRTELIPASQFEAACNFIGAYALEGELMGKEHVFSFKRDELSRYLVSFDRNGDQQVTPVPYDACVLSHRDLIAGMVVAGDIPVSTEDLFNFTLAALSRLQGRSEFQARRADA